MDLTGCYGHFRPGLTFKRFFKQAVFKSGSGLVLILAALFLAACQTVDSNTVQTQTYKSVWRQLYPTTLNQSVTTDSLQGHFRHAASAQTLDTASDQWFLFLSEWKPEDGLFEDGMQARLVDWAELELKRSQFLLDDNPAAAQDIEAELRQLAAEFE